MSTGPVGDRRGSSVKQTVEDSPETSARRPDRGDAEKFDKLVKDGGKGSAKGSGSGPDKEPGKGLDKARSQPEAGGMTDLFGQAARNLAGLQGQPVPGPMLAGPAEVASIAPSAPVDTGRCEELVERILVSQPTAEGAAEVRIKVDRNLLPDTEIRLVRTPDAGLSVEFMTDEVDAQRFLLPNLSELRSRLTDRTGEQVVVRMSEQGADTGQPGGDGRSRNRRNLYEEIGDNR